MNSNIIKIAPSILASDFSKLNDEIITIEKAGADFIHLDIMDGHFVPNLSFGPPIIKSLRNLTKLPFDVHLMVSNPDTLLKEYVNAGANIITVHVEACNHLARTLDYIKSKGCKAGVAINPHTDIQFIENVIEDLDLILVMTVNPGFGGQKFINSMVKKISLVKEIISSRDIFLEVDGGITKENSKEVIEAGANVLVAGTSVFNTNQKTTYKMNIDGLRG
jgi:ribulose-phosphate 3-epimerase